MFSLCVKQPQTVQVRDLKEILPAKVFSSDDKTMTAGCLNKML